MWIDTAPKKRRRSKMGGGRGGRKKSMHETACQILSEFISAHGDTWSCWCIRKNQ
jgi:hypothetical protein